MIHWLSLRIDGADLSVFMDCCSRVWGSDLGWRRRGKSDVWQSWLGFSVGIYRGYPSFIIPGGACDELEAFGIFRFVSLVLDEYNQDWLFHAGLKYICTRLDWSVDSLAFSPADLLARFRGAFTDGAHDDSIITGLRATSWRYYQSPDGDTCYLGSRESNRMIRCYNRRGHTRLELELHSERASMAFDCAFRQWEQGDNYSGYLSGLIRGMVDFPAWSEWLSVSSERVPVRVGRPSVSLSKTFRWFSRQCAGSYAILECAAPEFLASVYDKSISRPDILSRIVDAVSVLD